MRTDGLDRQALDRAISHFPVLFAAATNYGVEHPLVQKRVSDRFDEIVAEYHHELGVSAHGHR